MAEPLLDQLPGLQNTVKVGGGGRNVGTGQGPGGAVRFSTSHCSWCLLLLLPQA